MYTINTPLSTSLSPPYQIDVPIDLVVVSLNASESFMAGYVVSVPSEA